MRGMFLALCLVLLVACGGGSESPISSAQAQAPAPVYVVFGDSVTTGMMPLAGTVQLRQDLAYTKELWATGMVITASVGGQSTADAVASQLPRMRDVPASHLIVFLGINNAVRGMSIAQAQADINTLADAFPRAKLVLIAPPYWDEQTRAWLDEWRRLLQVMALVRGAEFVDAFTPSLGAQGWQCHPADHHPCPPAHRALGALITAAVTSVK